MWTLGELISDNMKVSILNGGYREYLRIEILVVTQKSLELIRKIKRMSLNRRYWWRDG